MELVASATKREAFFEELFDHFRHDKLLLDCNLAGEKREKFYNALITGNQFELTKQMSLACNDSLTQHAVIEYLVAIAEIEKLPMVLALDIHGRKISVFAVVEDDDEEVEDTLYLTEAKVNAGFYDHDVSISTTVLEKSDNCHIPNHYHVLKDGRV